jgi:hypothetical protein
VNKGNQRNIQLEGHYGLVDGKTVFSEDLGSCILAWKNPNRTRGCKSSLKVREREIQREQGRVHWQRACFSFLDTFKTYTNPWGGKTQEIPTQ